jgi:hypothetical protein
MFNTPEDEVRSDAIAVMKAVNEARGPGREHFDVPEVEPQAGDDAVLGRLAERLADELEHRRASSDRNAA